MKLDTAKIPGYDTMSAEEKLNALLNYEIEEPKAAETPSGDYQKLRDALNKASSEAADFKRQLREKQSEAERQEAERQEYITRLETENKNYTRQVQISKHEADFLGVGYTPELAKTSAEAMTDGDTGKVFADLKAFLDAHDKSVQAGVLRQTPSPVGGAVESNITKEQFNAMNYKERVNLFETNPELYSKLNE